MLPLVLILLGMFFLQKTALIKKLKTKGQVQISPSMKSFWFLRHPDWNQGNFKFKNRTRKKYLVTRAQWVQLLRVPLNGGAQSRIQELRIHSLLHREEVAPGGNPTQYSKNMTKRWCS